MSEALSGVFAALGFILPLFGCRFALEKPCARARCVRRSMHKIFLAHIPDLRTCPYMPLHNVGMCGSLVRHAKRFYRYVPLHRYIRSFSVGFISCLSVLGFALCSVLVLRTTTFRSVKWTESLFYCYHTIV